MKTLAQLNEEISKVKLQKVYDKIQNKINENPDLYNRLNTLDFQNETEVHEFIDDVLGEPVGLWKNTKEEQIKLLKQIKMSMEDTRGIDFVRPDYSGDNGEF